MLLLLLRAHPTEKQRMQKSQLHGYIYGFQPMKMEIEVYPDSAANHITDRLLSVLSNMASEERTFLKFTLRIGITASIVNGFL